MARNVSSSIYSKEAGFALAGWYTDEEELYGQALGRISTYDRSKTRRMLSTHR